MKAKRGMEIVDNRRKFEWVETIVHNLELEEHDKDILGKFNPRRLQYLARRSGELVTELGEIQHGAGDSSLEFKARKQLKKMKDSLITVIN